MFKIESYITPILISYVEKYIKNLRAADSQVSLWGGDASFHNLDLRLDVLERELQLPFSLVSGHIHELSIHVPWTKLASEPISITINTIECVLKLRGSTENVSDSSQQFSRRKSSRGSKKLQQEQIEAPPGYVQSLVNKIVHNITINCKNLILKYVEEDIVVSVNIKLLTFESANENWEAAFTELSPTQVVIRKLIKLSDLTVCLDKRNASGKIEVYQEPMLYRCFVEIRLFRNYQSSSAKKASTTRLDIYCNKMEFSMTEQQIPMLMRLIMLLVALHQRQLKCYPDLAELITGSDPEDENEAPEESWTGWVWRAASSLMPAEEPEDGWNSNQKLAYHGHTLHTGFYIDHATFTFKVSECTTAGKGYYASRKLKYWPVLSLQLNGCFLETIAHGVEWFNAIVGISEALLLPHAHCTCGHAEVIDESQSPHYLKAGSNTNLHKIDSLFDPKGAENMNERKVYCNNVDFHLNIHTEAALLERTPAFAIDYLYKLEIPEDFSSDRMSELGSDLEYSNLSEMSLCRIVGGPVVLRVCSGFIHRMSTLRQVSATYDYPPYSTPAPVPNLNELHPPSEDDFDALNNEIPLRTYQFTFFKPVLEFELMDHQKFNPSKNVLFRKRKNISHVLNNYTLFYPKVTLECECIDAKIVNPMYPKRLVFTTCLLPTAPSKMFNTCYTHSSAKIIGLSSRLIFGINKCTTVLMPSNASLDYRSIIIPKFWINPDIPHLDISVEIESLTVSATKAKFMVVQQIIDRFIKLDSGELKNSIFMTSLLQDASNDAGMDVLELYVEMLRLKNVSTMSTVTYDIRLNSLKVFILEAKNDAFINKNFDSGLSVIQETCSSGLGLSTRSEETSHVEPLQVLVISGPEPTNYSCSAEYAKFQETPLLTATLQYPREIDNQIHPPLLFFSIAEVKICVDPHLFSWFLYTPRHLNLHSEDFWRDDSVYRRQMSEASGSFQDTPRKVATPHESVHSSSDRELSSRILTSVTDSPKDESSENSLSEFILKWYPVWTSAVLFGNILQCTIYFPTESLTAVGLQGIQEAIEMSLKKESPPEILVVKLPHCSIRSASQRKDLAHYTSHLPVKLPDSMWAPMKASFPWSFSVWDFCCYTFQNNSKFNFLKPLSGNATIGLSVKNRMKKETKLSKSDPVLEKKTPLVTRSADAFPSTSESSRQGNSISLLGICIHIDNTPIEISLSDIQLQMMSNILCALVEILNQKSSVFKEKIKPVDLVTSSSNRIATRSQSPNFFKESTAESVSEKTPTNSLADTELDDEEEIKLTLWMQWTIARLSFKLYSHNYKSDSHLIYLLPPTLKLVFDMEDIMSSLDLQKVYMKFKSKIVTASVQHFKRNNDSKAWEPGDYLGLVMRGQDEIPSTERQDDCGFMTITITKARCGHVHSKWGTLSAKKYKLSETKIDSSSLTVDTRYISEVVITLQPIDLLLSFDVLKHFYMIFVPLRNMYSKETHVKINQVSNVNTWLDNTKLPLAYLECHGLRIIMPVSDSGRTAHDICIFEVGNIHLAPMADNPICRTPLRPDIYQQAAQVRILNLPGSEIEDRQYQLTINALSLNTGLWVEFIEYLSRERGTVSFLHTMNENPALEWNNLGGKMNALPRLTLFPLIKKFDICFVAAPAIIYKDNIVVCGSSVEINFVSDIEITCSLCQIQLLSNLVAEFYNLCQENQEILSRQSKFSYLHIKKCSREESSKNDVDIFIEYTKDSGVETLDVTSDVTLKTKGSNEEKRNSSKLHFEKVSDKSSALKHTLINTNVSSIMNQFPTDILVTGGEISLCLYKIKNFNSHAKYLNKTSKKKDAAPNMQDKGYEASEEGSVDENNMKQEMQPIFFILFAQPNLFCSQLKFINKINFSCFDISFKVSSPEYKPVQWIPTINDFPLNLIETKSGTPDPDTGIPPAFLTLKFMKGIGKNPSLNIDVERPIKITYCLAQLNYLLHVREKITSIFKNACVNLSNNIFIRTQNDAQVNVMQHNQQSSEVYSKYKEIKTFFCGLYNVNVKLVQVVFEFKTSSGSDMVLSINKLKNCLVFSNRPEKITNEVNLENVVVTCNHNGSKKILLNPWMCNFDVCFFWESWQNANSDPQIQLSADSDCFIVDIGPEQLKTIESVVKECKELLSCLQLPATPTVESKSTLTPERDQYYKDDLRAGAFQFIEATGGEDELPLPYQVMFWNDTIAAMAWRYPQPRVLTKVRVFPVPFKLSRNPLKDEQMVCNLEYWSDCHGSYHPYTQFKLSESEICYLDLPKDCPKPAVSCTWRVVLFTVDRYEKTKGGAKALVSPQALAACMRIDSYFNPLLVPKIQISMKLSSVCLQLYNQFDNDVPMTMPEALQGYTADGLIPNNQCFFKLSIENSIMFLATWSYDTAMLDFTSSVRCDILNYSCITQEPFVLPFTLKITMNVADTMNINVVSKSINTKFSSSIGHTLAVSAQIWQQAWNVKTLGEPSELVILTRYVICNNTNYNLRFGQAATEEDILLSSKFVHMYSWRSQKISQKIRVGLEQNGWLWSEPIDIDTVRTETIDIDDKNHFSLIVTVKALSASQKQITFSGQLIICNMLLEHFEMKLVPATCENRDAFRTAPNHIISGKSLSPTLVVNLKQKLCLRLRFYGLESAWSGGIPMEENTKCFQPWLVKVPLQERGQFLSIWCRIVEQNCEKDRRVLVLLWPLFMVRSNLPMNAEVHIETPVLNVNVETVIRGRGQLQQLYCPGTIDHSHQLTFQLDAETPVSNPYVPLNYSLVDQKLFFRKPDHQNIDEIIDVLKKIDESEWPYIGKESKNIEWIAEDQPLTHVQVHYQNACAHSSALLVELLPWCLILNTLGCDIAIIGNNGRELCRTRHNGVVTPPKLDSTFQISVGIGETWNISSILQLAKPDWSQSFYKPKINGVIPLEGNVKLPIKCENGICVTSINSKVCNEIQVLEIKSSHVLTNHTSLQLHVTCLALDSDSGKRYNIPSNVNKYSFILAPNLESSHVGVPIIHWYAPYTIADMFSSFTLHIIFSLDRKYKCCCPVQVDGTSFRKSISICNDQRAIPLVLVAQLNQGCMYLSVHHDYHPQLLIDNKCNSIIYCAQYGTDDTPIKDNPYLNWICTIQPNFQVYYTLPTISEKFPEINQNGSESIVIAVPNDNRELIWSQSVDINNHNEQYLRIPKYGDVKLLIKKISYTTLITVMSITEIEISAGDIRSRLIYHENQMKYLLENSLQVQKNLSDENAETSSLVPFLKGNTASTTTLSSVYYSSTDILANTTDNHTNTDDHQTKDIQIMSRSNWSDLHSRSFNQDYSFSEKPAEYNSLSINIFIESFVLQLFSDAEESGFEQNEIAMLTCDNIAVTTTKSQGFNVCMSVSEIQFDNQLFNKHNYDFPVFFIGQGPSSVVKLNSLNSPIKTLISDARKNALVVIDLYIEEWRDGVVDKKIREIKDIKVNIKPISIFVEDTYITKLIEIFTNLSPVNLVIWPKHKPRKNFNLNSTLSLVDIPEPLIWEANILARPLVLQSLSIEPVSILLSIHSSIKLYIALDRSPLQFSKFEKKNMMTTSYRLGHTLTMHYISGAIFASGWMIGSLELLGSPGGLARSLGSGLLDFVSLPYYGFIQGPWQFIIGITHGSASLMRHVTAGTLHSVTKMASSVARNLDRLTMDEEHLQRTEELRRYKPQGLGQGLIQGLTGLGISLLGAVGGIAHHPLQSVMKEGVSPRGLAAGVGLGLVGVITKPLSGAAELVAQTGQGLLQGAGWNSLPEPRSCPTSYHNFTSTNSILKYKWKFLNNITSHSNLLVATEATLVTSTSEYIAIALILTNEALIIFNTDEDSAERIIHLNDIIGIDTTTDPTLICFILKVQPKSNETDPPEMDPACRERVANYVRNSASLMRLPSRDSSLSQSDVEISPAVSGHSTPARSTTDSPKMRFFVNPQCRNYFCNVLTFVKQQNQDNAFQIL